MLYHHPQPYPRPLQGRPSSCTPPSASWPPYPAPTASTGVIHLVCASAQPSACTTAALDHLYTKLQALDQQFSNSHEGDCHQLWTRQTILARWWLEDGMATFWLVDDHTSCLFCRCFMALHPQKVTGYCLEPELTAKEASKAQCLKHLVACTGTCLVLLGDYALLRPHTGDHPCGHLLDFAVVHILALYHYFPDWAACDPTSWPLHTLEQLTVPPWA